MQVSSPYVIDAPLDGKVTVALSTGTMKHKNVTQVYVGPKNVTVCTGPRGRAEARYPRLSVIGFSYLGKHPEK